MTIGSLGSRITHWDITDVLKDVSKVTDLGNFDIIARLQRTFEPKSTNWRARLASLFRTLACKEKPKPVLRQVNLRFSYDDGDGTLHQLDPNPLNPAYFTDCASRISSGYDSLLDEALAKGRFYLAHAELHSDMPSYDSLPDTITTSAGPELWINVGRGRLYHEKPNTE